MILKQPSKKAGNACFEGATVVNALAYKVDLQLHMIMLKQQVLVANFMSGCVKFGEPFLNLLRGIERSRYAKKYRRGLAGGNLSGAIIGSGLKVQIFLWRGHVGTFLHTSTFQGPNVN